jgi:DNA polymerase elongation subunit (family B)
VGHNNENFDIPYEEKRMRVLKINENAPFKCIYGTKKMFTPISVEKVSTFSKAFGGKSQSMIDMAGASCMDTYTIATREMKKSSYTLNFLAKDLFKTKKADCPYEAIPGTFYNDLGRLLFYNEKDVALTGRIFNYLNSAINTIEFVKLAGCFKQQECYTRG